MAGSQGQSWLLGQEALAEMLKQQQRVIPLRVKTKYLKTNWEGPREGPKHRWQILEAAEWVQGLGYRTTPHPCQSVGLA